MLLADGGRVCAAWGFPVTVEQGSPTPTDQSNARLVIYAIDKDMLPGPYPPPGHPPDGTQDAVAAVAWYDAQFPVPLFTKHEATEILLRRVVLHHTYSLQQDAFGRMGFEVTSDPWRVALPDRTLVVCIGTRDRYGIFGDNGPEIHQFDTVEAWREGRDAEAEGWAS